MNKISVQPKSKDASTFTGPLGGKGSGPVNRCTIHIDLNIELFGGKEIRLVIAGVKISVLPSMEEGPIIWKQTVTVSCLWTPGSRMYGDIVVGKDDSIWSDPIYGETVSKEST